MKKLLMSAVVVAMVAMPATAKADPPTAPNCAFAGIGSYNWGANVQYLGCIGSFEGNNKGNAATLANTLSQLEGSWSTSASQEWTSMGDLGFGTGTLAFAPDVVGIYAIALKQASAYGLYYFNALSPISGMNYSTAGVQAGATTGLSHATLYQITGDVVQECPNGGIPPCEGPSIVSEPSSLALMGAGLFMVCFVSRRRRLS